MMSLAQVRRWDPAAVETAFTQLGTAREQLLNLDFDLTQARPPDTWLGKTADIARVEHERLAEQLRRNVAAIAALRPTLADTTDAITALHRDLDLIDTDAAHTGFSVTPTGTITDTTHTAVAPDQLDTYRQQRATGQTAIVSRLESVLHRADEIDTTLADLLHRAATGQIDDGATTTTLAGADTVGAAAAQLHISPPPPVTIPAVATAWWNGMTPAEHDRVLAEHPDWVGNLDGIPATTRDQANRARLPGEITRLDTEIAAAQVALDRVQNVDLPPWVSREGDVPPPEAQTLYKLQSQRDALTAIEQSLNGPDRKLLLLDIDGHVSPRAAVAVGDIDTATHVAVFTPGFTTTVAQGLPGVTNDIAALRQTAQLQLLKSDHPGESVAAVTWIGYDVPQWDTLDEHDRSVLGSAAAQHGGADLAHFYDGINTSRTTDPHLTALGHSYGSTTTGYALQHTTTPIDDAVVFGSPGLGTSDVTDLHVPAGHTAALRANLDPVASFGAFGQKVSTMDGVVDLSTTDHTLPNGVLLNEVTGHSDYLTPGSTSQYNIAATINGLTDRRITIPREWR